MLLLLGGAVTALCPLGSPPDSARPMRTHDQAHSTRTVRTVCTAVYPCTAAALMRFVRATVANTAQCGAHEAAEHRSVSGPDRSLSEGPPARVD